MLAQSSLTLFNYYDGIFIGVEQGLYIEEIVKDHLGKIIQAHVQWTKESPHSVLVKRVGALHENFPNMISYYNKWASEAGKPAFKDEHSNE